VTRAALLALSHDDLIDLILAQHARIEAQAGQITALTARVTELEARLAAPRKSSDNSSQPPSRDPKPNLPAPTEKRPRPRRPGMARALAEHPDKIIEATLVACPRCDHALAAADMADIHAGACPRAGQRPDPGDHIDRPPIRPIVTRINRHRGVCPCRRKHVAAPAPRGFEPVSPFGPGIAALILHLHITQAISFERLARVMAEVFGLTISGGAIAISWPARGRTCGWPIATAGSWAMAPRARCVWRICCATRPMPATRATRRSRRAFASCRCVPWRSASGGRR
jgi:transposase